MASVYCKETGIYYISVMFQNKRITRSLGTRSYKVARKLTSHVEKQILAELVGVKKADKKTLSFPQLVRRYLEYPDHAWADSTRERNRCLLKNYLSDGLPENPTTKAMTIRVVNSCNNWGIKHGLIDKRVRLEGGSRWAPRNRVLNNDELKLLFNEVKNEDFNAFVRFAYYTGARSGEIRHIQADNIKDKYLLVTGKTGERIVKISTQAGIVLKNQNPLWAYTKNYVSHKFKKEVRRLGIKDARFHDLRRTFGYNLIKQGISIYKVSKLLGHKSVTTTERHYAPLLTTEIEDFVL